MKEHRILVLADSADTQLAMLEELRGHAQFAVGNAASVFERDTEHATVILNWSASLEVFCEVFRKCPNLEWVHTRSVGLERTLFPELIESSLPLTNGTGVFSAALGEFAVAAILYFAKDFRRMISNQAAGVWEAFDILPVEGHRVGIVGYGDIGRAVASRARALGMQVLAVRRNAAASIADPLVDHVYGPERCIEMLSLSDYVVVAAPLTAETRGMIGRAEFAAMRPTAVIVNVGRGPVIDEGALVRALTTGGIRGAALDVFDQEPLPSDHPYYRLENVLLSPHCADHTPDWLEQAMRFFLAQFERFRNGQPLLNLVDKRLGY